MKGSTHAAVSRDTYKTLYSEMQLYNVDVDRYNKRLDVAKDNNLLPVFFGLFGSRLYADTKTQKNRRHADR